MPVHARTAVGLLAAALNRSSAVKPSAATLSPVQAPSLHSAASAYKRAFGAFTEPEQQHILFYLMTAAGALQNPMFFVPFLPPSAASHF